MSDDKVLNDKFTKEELERVVEQIKDARRTRGPTMGRPFVSQKGEPSETRVELDCGGAIIIRYWGDEESPDDASTRSQEFQIQADIKVSDETMEEIREAAMLEAMTVTYHGIPVVESDNTEAEDDG